jgi:hypothetical protein
MLNPYENYNPHECEEFKPENTEDYICCYCNEIIKKREFLYFLEKNCKLNKKDFNLTNNILTSNRYLNNDLLECLYNHLISFNIFNISFDEYKEIRLRAWLKEELEEDSFNEFLLEEFTEIFQEIQPEGFYFCNDFTSEDSYGFFPEIIARIEEKLTFFSEKNIKILSFSEYIKKEEEDMQKVNNDAFIELNENTRIPLLEMYFYNYLEIIEGDYN